MNTANLFYAIIGIATVVVLWTANHKRNHEKIRELEAQYQKDLDEDSVVYNRNMAVDTTAFKH